MINFWVFELVTPFYKKYKTYLKLYGSQWENNVKCEILTFLLSFKPGSFMEGDKFYAHAYMKNKYT